MASTNSCGGFPASAAALAFLGASSSVPVAKSTSSPRRRWKRASSSAGRGRLAAERVELGEHTMAGVILRAVRRFNPLRYRTHQVGRRQQRPELFASLRILIEEVGKPGFLIPDLLGGSG